MLRITLLALLVAVASANPFIKPRMIEGVVSCGSEGQLLNLDLTDAADNSKCAKVPCLITIGHSYNIQADFVPKASHSSMNVKATVTFADGVPHALVDTNLPVAVEAGKPYSFTYPWTVTGTMGKGPCTLHIEVGNDNVLELCGEAGGDIRE